MKMRIWHIAKLSGQAPETVERWDAEWFLWAEAIEQYWSNEQAKAMKQRRR